MSWDTSQAAEQAFYTALANRDQTTMDAVWLDSPEAVCIHPGQPRLHGVENIRNSWTRILTGDQRLKLELRDRRIVSDGTIAVHHLTEVLTDQDSGGVAQAITTNVYRNTEQGWRIVMHHSSPAVVATATARSAAPKKTTLH